MPQSPFGTPKQVDAWMGLVILTRNIGNAIAIAGSLSKSSVILVQFYIFLESLRLKDVLFQKLDLKK